MEWPKYRKPESQHKNGPAPENVWLPGPPPHFKKYTIHYAKILMTESVNDPSLATVYSGVRPFPANHSTHANGSALGHGARMPEKYARSLGNNYQTQLKFVIH